MNRPGPSFSDPRRTELIEIKPGQYRFRHLMLRLGMTVLDALLGVIAHPDRLFAALTRMNRRICGMHRRTVTSRDVIWPYLEGGSGETIVLLHGFGATKDHMVSMAYALSRCHHIVIPDLPGYGEHAPDWSARYDVDTLARKLLSFVDTMGLGRFHLLGVSLGGYVAAYFAARHENRVATLALMDTAGMDTPIPSDAMRLYRETGRNIFLYTNAAEYGHFMRYLVHRLPGMPDRMASYWSEAGIARLAWRKKLFNDLDHGGLGLLEGLAQRISAPTLLLWGKQDRICHVSAVRMLLERICRCEACIFSPCGHLPMIEYPRISRAVYHKFLTRVKTAHPAACSPMPQTVSKKCRYNPESGKD